jgi:hypothetical protein
MLSSPQLSIITLNNSRQLSNSNKSLQTPLIKSPRHNNSTPYSTSQQHYNLIKYKLAAFHFPHTPFNRGYLFPSVYGVGVVCELTICVVCVCVYVCGRRIQRSCLDDGCIVVGHFASTPKNLIVGRGVRVERGGDCFFWGKVWRIY